jgi:hypothetical protein
MIETLLRSMRTGSTSLNPFFGVKDVLRWSETLSLCPSLLILQNEALMLIILLLLSLQLVLPVPVAHRIFLLKQHLIVPLLQEKGRTRPRNRLPPLVVCVVFLWTV